MVCSPSQVMVTRSAEKSHIVVFTKSALAGQTAPAALGLADVSKIVSHVSFGDLDLDANHVGDARSWTPAVGDAGIETYETYLAIDAAGSGGMLAGGVAGGTNVHAVSSDTDSTGKSHIVVYTKSSLAEQTTPAALLRTDESLGVSNVSFEDLNFDLDHVGADLTWTPPVSDEGIETYETYLATDAAGSGGVLTGSVAMGTNVYAVSIDTDSTGRSHIVVFTKSALAEPTTPAALVLTDVSKIVCNLSFGEAATAT